jgi:hypothetical protein
MSEFERIIFLFSESIHPEEPSDSDAETDLDCELLHLFKSGFILERVVDNYTSIRFQSHF